MTILVAGATGNVGRPTVAALLSSGEPVRALSRSEDKFGDLPEGAEGAVADLETGGGLDAAFDGVDRFFLITANGETETQRGLNAVNAAKSAGVGRIVYLSVHNPDQEPPIPHSRSKLPIEAAIRESGAEYTILRPSYFNQTDLSVVRVVKDFGVYPMPIGTIGQNRVDTRDIADCAVRALTGDGHNGAEYDLHGPDTISGPGAAAVYAKHFGREVFYGGDDVGEVGRVGQGFPRAWLLESLKKMFLPSRRMAPRPAKPRWPRRRRPWAIRCAASTLSWPNWPANRGRPTCRNYARRPAGADRRMGCARSRGRRRRGRITRRSIRTR